MPHISGHLGFCLKMRFLLKVKSQNYLVGCYFGDIVIAICNRHHIKLHLIQRPGSSNNIIER